MNNNITKKLQKMGITPNLKGYHYIRQSVILIVEYPNDYLNSVTRTLYHEVAKEFNTSPSCVERAIRHAITKTRYRLGPAQFLFMVAEDVKAI